MEGRTLPIVTYCDSSTVWFEIQELVTTRLPLKNVGWLQQGRTQRLLEELSFRFEPFKPDMFPRAVPGSPSPFVAHLFLINEEDPEVYKSTIKKQVQDWHSVISTKKHQEPLIVCISASDKRKTTTPRFLNVGGSVYDRVKSDFSKLNSVHLKPSSANDTSIWNDFFAKLREVILVSFNGKLLQYEEDTRRMDAQRLLPGWNYCQFFILKDGAACTYEYFNITEDALLQYDELEAAFFQNLLEQGAPWFQSFGGAEVGNDSHNILNTSRKPYRDLILQNTITIFDFRTYLFARQVQLLSKTSSSSGSAGIAQGIVEICVRAKKFITSFARTLREYSAGLVPYFTESWIYSACLNIVSHCEDLLSNHTQNANISPLYESAKAEILHYARLQLDILGSASEMYTTTIHKVASMHDFVSEHNHPELVDRKPPIETITNSELKVALSSQENFDKLYLSISSRAVKGYEQSKRKRTTTLLKGDIAALHFNRKRYLEAYTLWTEKSDNDPSSISSGVWASVGQDVLEMIIVCLQRMKESQTNAPEDGPQITEMCLRLLESKIQDGNLRGRGLDAYVDLLNERNDNIPALHELRFHDMMIFKVSISRFINRVANGEYHELEIVVESHLPKEIKIDEIQGSLSSKISAGVVCRCNARELVPGPNKIRLICEKIASSGTYVVDTIELRLGGVTLLYDMAKSGGGIKTRSFQISEQQDALQVTLNVLDNPESANKIRKKPIFKILRIAITSPTWSIKSAIFSTAILASAFISTKNEQPIRFHVNMRETGTASRQVPDGTISTEGAVVLPAFNLDEVLEFSLPLVVDHSNVEEVDIKTTLQYTTTENKDQMHAKQERLRVRPVLQISHVAIPRDDGTLLQIKVTGTSKEPIRIGKAWLTGIDEAFVQDFSTRTNASFVFNEHTVAFVYVLEKAVREGKELTFNIEYQSASAEITKKLMTRLNSFLESKDKHAYSSILQHDILNQIRASAASLCPMSFQYAMTGHANLPQINYDTIAKEMGSEDSSVIKEVCGLLKQFVDEEKSNKCGLVEWDMENSSIVEFSELGYDGKVMQYNFGIADYQIVVGVDIKPSHSAAPNTRKITTGDIVSCKLTIEPISWTLTDESVTAQYEIHVCETNWALAGHQKRKFKLSKDLASEFELVLVAVGAGRELMPRVTVCGGDGAVDNGRVYCKSVASQEILVFPSESKQMVIGL